MSARFPTTAQKLTPWQIDRMQREQPTLFPVPPMDPAIAALPFEEPPPEMAYDPQRETSAARRKRWLKKHQDMEG